MNVSESEFLIAKMKTTLEQDTIARWVSMATSRLMRWGRISVSSMGQGEGKHEEELCRARQRNLPNTLEATLVDITTVVPLREKQKTTLLSSNSVWLVLYYNPKGCLSISDIYIWGKPMFSLFLSKTIYFKLSTEWIYFKNCKVYAINIISQAWLLLETWCVKI